MAQQMYNPFQPMAQAQQGLNQALVTAGKLKRQRKRNKLKNMLTRAKMANEMQGVRQQAGLRNYLSKRRQLAQKRQNEYDETQGMIQEGIQAPPGVGMSEGTGKEFLSQMGERPQFNPQQAQYDYWKQTDIEKGNKIAEDVLAQAKKIHDMGDPQGAAQHIRENLGVEAEFKGEDKYEIKTKEGNLIRLDASDEEPPQIWRDGEWQKLEGRIPQRPEDDGGTGRGDEDPWIRKKRKLQAFESRAKRILNDYERAQSDVLAMFQAAQAGNASMADLNQAMDSAYAVLKRQADKGKVKARNDLKKLQELRARMDEVIGLDIEEAPEPSPESKSEKKEDPLGLFE